jgi:hypothetical protein
MAEGGLELSEADVDEVNQEVMDLETKSKRYGRLCNRVILVIQGVLSFLHRRYGQPYTIRKLP